MPRTARAAVGGVVYHVLNRGNDRRRIFHKPGDYNAFLRLLVEGRQRAGVEVFGFCLMPNHWHVVLRPSGDRDLAAYLSWVTNTHVKRYHAHHRRTGHLYQGRYKSFPVRDDAYFLTLLRYVEANPLRARLAKPAERWAWSSLGWPDVAGRAEFLADWPVDRPAGWTKIVNSQQPDAEQSAVRESIRRGRPLGPPEWTVEVADRLGLAFTLRPRGRPREAARPV